MQLQTRGKEGLQQDIECESNGGLLIVTIDDVSHICMHHT